MSRITLFLTLIPDFWWEINSTSEALTQERIGRTAIMAPFCNFDEPLYAPFVLSAMEKCRVA